RRRLSSAAGIVADDAMPAGKRLHLAVPHAPVEGEAGDQDDGRTGTGDLVIEAATVDRCKAGLRRCAHPLPPFSGQFIACAHRGSRRITDELDATPPSPHAIAFTRRCEHSADEGDATPPLPGERGLLSLASRRRA